MSPTVESQFGEKRDLVSANAPQQALLYGVNAAPFGTLYAISHAYWFATPAKVAYTNMAVKTALWGGVGAVYQGTTTLAAGVRGKNDAFNQAIGGFLGGALAGLGTRGTVVHGLSYGAFLSALASVTVLVLEQNYESSQDRATKQQTSEKRLPGFLATPHDHFAKRLAQLEEKQS